MAASPIPEFLAFSSVPAFRNAPCTAESQIFRSIGTVDHAVNGQPMVPEPALEADGTAYSQARDEPEGSMLIE